MKLDFDWTDSDPETREALDVVFASSTLCSKADNAACGWFTLQTSSEEEVAESLRSFAETLEKAADKIEQEAEQ